MSVRVVKVGIVKTNNNMKRQIKFRGKSVETGEWVYGYVVYTPNGQYAKIICEGDGGMQKHSPVDPTTVGQLVNIKNEHGFEVYEDDIIYSSQWSPTTHKVCFDRGAFYIGDKDNEEIADIKYAEGFKVIGNTHDNPALLGSGSNETNNNE